MTINYFHDTPSRQWKVLDALAFYDSKKMSATTLLNLVLEMKQDLIRVGITQTSMKKHVNAALTDVQKILNLTCYRTTYDTQESQNPLPNETINNDERPSNVAPEDDDKSDNTSSEPKHSDKPERSSGNEPTDATLQFDKVSDVFNNHGQVNIGPSTVAIMKHKVLGKRRVLEDITNPLASSEVAVAEGSNMYRLTTPSGQSERPHKPKLRKNQIEALKQLFHFGASFSADDPVTIDEYNAHKKEQKRNNSLSSLGLLAHVTTLLDDEEPYGSFVKNVWTSGPDGALTDQAKAFLEIIKYTLTSFHLVCRTMPVYVQNHERTHFVESVVPSLLALGRITGFVEFKWCETEFLSSKVLNLKDHDYDLRAIPASKYIDALGILTTQNNMELVIVEASSGKMKENTTHTIEDSLKILECGVAALRKEAAHYKDASLATFKKLKVYAVQVIKTQVTLSEMVLYDDKYWKFVEKRSAKMPTVWNDRLFFVQYLELLASLYEACLMTQQVQKQLVRENLGLAEYEGSSVGSIMQDPQ